jgi:hypothetical protein
MVTGGAVTSPICIASLDVRDVPKERHYVDKSIFE